MGSSSKLQRSSNNYKEATIEELTRGHELVSRLRDILGETSSTNNIGKEDSTAMSLIKEVMGSISRALIALDFGVKPEEKYRDDDDDDDEKKGIFSGKRNNIRSVQKGGYRKRSHPYSCKRTTTTLNDGHSWRKYGQKAIYSAQFPRSYFRCTHKYDQDCQASRQVQQSEEDQSLFVITYFGEHTCHDPAEAILYSHSLQKDDPCIINFASHKQKPDGFPILKQESDEEVVSNDPTITPDTSSSHYFDLPELSALEGSTFQLADEFGFRDAFDQNENDVTSGLPQSWSDFMENSSFQFHDVFSF